MFLAASNLPLGNRGDKQDEQIDRRRKGTNDVEDARITGLHDRRAAAAAVAARAVTIRWYSGGVHVAVYYGKENAA